MISLCKDINSVTMALEVIKGDVFITEIIRLYLESYGTDFEFNEFFIQYSDSEYSSPASVIHRYNNQIYINTGSDSDFHEIRSFIAGFTDCTVIGNNLLLCENSQYSDCFVMSKSGQNSEDFCDYMVLCDNPKAVAELVCKDYTKEKKTDFFLNTAYQIRHNNLLVYGIYVQNELICVASCTEVNPSVSLLTFVYTDEYFRGKGYMKKLLFGVCTDTSKEYVLLCSENNTGFYKKCGFNTVNKLIEFRL